MTVREWKNIMWGLFFITLYASLVNFLGFKGTGFYIACGVGAAICCFFLYRLKHSSDKMIVKDYIDKYKEKKFDRFDTDNYVLAVETSDKKLTRISSIVTENYSKDDILNMLHLVQEWKKENNFVWNTSNLYDVIVIEGIIDENKKLKTIVRKIENTKYLKIYGVLTSNGVTKVIKNKKDTKDLFFDKKNEEVSENLYTINGLDFCLTNVYPNDIGKEGMWSISIDKTKEGYYGVIVNREFKDKDNKGV